MASSVQVARLWPLALLTRWTDTGLNAGDTLCWGAGARLRVSDQLAEFTGGSLLHPLGPYPAASSERGLASSAHRFASARHWASFRLM